MVHVRLNEKESNPNPHINFISTLPYPDDGSAPSAEDAKELLKALAAQVKPIMKDHGFVINSFEEVGQLALCLRKFRLFTIVNSTRYVPLCLETRPVVTMIRVTVQSRLCRSDYLFKLDMRSDFSLRPELERRGMCRNCSSQAGRLLFWYRYAPKHTDARGTPNVMLRNILAHGEGRAVSSYTTHAPPCAVPEIVGSVKA